MPWLILFPEYRTGNPWATPQDNGHEDSLVPPMGCVGHTTSVPMLTSPYLNSLLTVTQGLLPDTWYKAQHYKYLLDGTLGLTTLETLRIGVNIFYHVAVGEERSPTRVREKRTTADI